MRNKDVPYQRYITGKYVQLASVTVLGIVTTKFAYIGCISEHFELVKAKRTQKIILFSMFFYTQLYRQSDRLVLAFA